MFIVMRCTHLRPNIVAKDILLPRHRRCVEIGNSQLNLDAVQAFSVAVRVQRFKLIRAHSIFSV